MFNCLSFFLLDDVFFLLILLKLFKLSERICYLRMYRTICICIILFKHSQSEIVNAAKLPLGINEILAHKFRYSSSNCSMDSITNMFLYLYYSFNRKINHKLYNLKHFVQRFELDKACKNQILFSGDTVGYLPNNRCYCK